MTPEIAIIGLVGVVIGAIPGFVASKQRSKVDLSIAERGFQTQLAVADRQFKAQLAAERERSRRERVEEAHTELMRWTAELELALDQVWDGLHSADPEALRRTRHLIDEWPWETLRVPDHAAGFQHYWSDKTLELINRFRAESSEFSTTAHMALRDELGRAIMSDEEALAARADTVWRGRSRLRATLEELRRSVRHELFDDNLSS